MENNIRTIEEVAGQNSHVRVLEYQQLLGSNNIDGARTLYYAAQTGMRLRQVQITLNNGDVLIEAGALSYMCGNIHIDTKTGGLAGFAQKALASALTNEATFKPHYVGTGEIYLEPSFGNFLLVKLDNEEMITDKGMFHASENTVTAGVAVQKNISSALFGGEGLFQTKLSGTGWVVLESPVPMLEIRRITLNNEKLQVDGNFALLRKGKIEYHVEKSTKSFMGSMQSGEGLLQTFSGTGEVWLAPTQSIYRRLQASTLATLAQASRSVGQNTK
jgi:uncharacterized protein (AIM24 family)